MLRKSYSASYNALCYVNSKKYWLYIQTQPKQNYYLNSKTVCYTYIDYLCHVLLLIHASFVSGSYLSYHYQWSQLQSTNWNTTYTLKENSYD